MAATLTSLIFPDGGDVDMNEAIHACQRGGYQGIFCSDHAPLSEVDPNRGRFMARALGYTRDLLLAAGYKPKIATLTACPCVASLPQLNRTAGKVFEKINQFVRG